MGVSGLADANFINHCADLRFRFRSKGNLHAVKHSASLLAPRVAEENRMRIDGFAKAVVTDMRLEQGWRYLGQKDMRRLGVFTGWLINNWLLEQYCEKEGLQIGKGKLISAVAAIASSK